MSHDDLTNVTLIRRLQAGGGEEDWAAFDRVYRRIIVGWARALGCSSERAMDMYQETMITLLRSVDRFQHSGEPGCFRKWLKTLAKRRVYAYYRWEAKHQAKGDEPVDASWEPEERPDETREREATMDRVWIAELVRESLGRALERVTPEKQKSFTLYVLDGRPVLEVASALDIREGTIYQHKTSVLDYIREELMKLLDGVGECTPQWQGADGRQAVEKAIADYLEQRDLEAGTAELLELPQAVVDRVELVRSVLGTHPPPGAGDWLGVVELGKTAWHPLGVGLTLGRRDSCAVVLTHTGVSGVHAAIRRDADEWLLQDQDSTNGTWRNGARTAQAVLCNGDVLTLGRCSAVVLLGL